MDTLRYTSPKKRFSIWRVFAALLGTFFVLCIGFLLGYATPRRANISVLPESVQNSISALSGSDTIDMNVFDVVWDRISTDYLYINDVTATRLYHGLLKGLVAGLGDPYSVFFDPEETDEFNSDLDGTFEGIGAEIGMKEGVPTIVSPLDGSPAEKAGLKANDGILYINNESTSGLDLDQAVAKIRGEKGTTVTLTISRIGTEQPFDVQVERNTIHIKSVSSEIRGDMAILSISTFNEQTVAELDDAVQSLLLSSPQGVVLDLRNNPGGLLSVSIDVAGVFLPQDSVVVIERDSAGVEVRSKTKRQGKLTDTPLVVLINGGSASASEILAGALKDHDRAVIVGEKSFGKGTVQSFETLSDGSSIKLTVSEWLTPSGHAFDGVGLEPDVLVEMTDEDYTNGRDPQLDRALEELL